MVFWWPLGILVGNQHLFCWAHGDLVATWNLGRHPDFLSVGTWFLLATWPSWFTPGVYSGGQLPSSWALGVFLSTTKHLGGHLASLQAPSISFRWHPVSWWVPSISFCGHMILWLAPSFSFGRLVTFIWLGTQRSFSWPCGIFVATCILGRHLAFLLLGMLCFGGHLASW